MNLEQKYLQDESDDKVKIYSDKVEEKFGLCQNQYLLDSTKCCLILWRYDWLKEKMQIY